VFDSPLLVAVAYAEMGIIFLFLYNKTGLILHVKRKINFLSPSERYFILLIVALCVTLLMKILFETAYTDSAHLINLELHQSRSFAVSLPPCILFAVLDDFAWFASSSQNQMVFFHSWLL